MAAGEPVTIGEGMTISNPPPLDYAPSPASLRRWRKRLRRVLLTILTIAAAFSAWRWGPPICAHEQTLYWQRQCLRYTASPDQVVYDEDPTRAAALKGADSAYVGYPAAIPRGGMQLRIAPLSAAAYQPRCWTQFVAITRAPAVSVARPRGAIIYLHDMRTPAGEMRLVAVEFSPEAGDFSPQFINGENYEGFVLVPATWDRPPRRIDHGYALSVMVQLPVHPPNLRIYAGQPDPADPSHFTVRYEMWGKEDVADGRLNNSGRVTLRQRNRPEEPRLETRKPKPE